MPDLCRGDPPQAAGLSGQPSADRRSSIVDRDVWDRTQQNLADNLQGKARIRIANPSLLGGKLIDANGEPLISTHATSGTRRYRYYVSRKLHEQPGSDGMRIPATEIETAVCSRVAEMFDDAMGLAGSAYLDVAASDVADFATRCQDLSSASKLRDRTLIHAVVQRVWVHDSRIEIDCDAGGVAAALKVEVAPNTPGNMSLVSDVRLTRSGTAMRLIQTDGSTVAPVANGPTVRLVLKARRWWNELRKGEVNIKTLARNEGVQASYVTRVIRLAFLAPAVVDAALAGTVLPHVDAKLLTLGDAVHPTWSEQRTRLLAKSTRSRAFKDGAHLAK